MKKVILKLTTERGFPEWAICDYLDQEEWIEAFSQREDAIDFCRYKQFKVYTELSDIEIKLCSGGKRK